MSPTTMTGPKGRMELGMVLIALGLFLTLGQARVLDLDGLGRFWPLFLIGIGLVKFRQPIEDGQRAIGAALLFAGGFFQVMTVLSWWRAWPLALVFVGGLLMWQAAARPGAPPPLAAPSPFISELALMGGSKRSLHIPDFQGGYITAVMGGVELDLRKCKLSGSAAVLDVVAFWGGIDLKIPADWRVEGQVLPLMGGFEDKTQALVASDQAPRLVLRGYAIMGGVAIGH